MSQSYITVIGVPYGDPSHLWDWPQTPLRCPHSHTDARELGPEKGHASSVFKAQVNPITHFRSYPCFCLQTQTKHIWISFLHSTAGPLLTPKVKQAINCCWWNHYSLHSQWLETKGGIRVMVPKYFTMETWVSGLSASVLVSLTRDELKQETLLIKMR